MKESLKLFIIGTVLCIAGSLILDEFYRSLVVEMCIYYLLAQSVSFLYGYMGVLSFGQALFFGLSSSIVALGIHYFDEPLIIWVVLALFSCTLVSIIFGYALSRLEGHNFVIFSVLVSLFPFFLSNTFSDITGGDDGLSLDFPISNNLSFNSIVNDPLYFYFFTVLIVILVCILTWTLYKSPFGLISKGIRENQFRMELLGYNLAQHNLYVYIISGYFAGISGILYVLFSKYLSSSYFHWSLSGEAIVWASFIGRGTFWGPFVGTAFLLMLKEELSSYTGAYQIIIGFLLIFSILTPASITRILSKKLISRLSFVYRYVRTINHSPMIVPEHFCPTESQKLVSEVFKCNDLTLKLEESAILSNITVEISLVTGVSVKIRGNHIKTLPLKPYSEKKMAIAIVGENGAGKTTLLNILSGIQKGFNGKAVILGNEILSKTNNQPFFFSGSSPLPIGRTFQRVEIFPNLSVRENILLGHLASQIKTDNFSFLVSCDNYSSRIESIGSTFGLDHFLDNYVNDLSYGQKKALELTLVIVADSKLLLLDEPFNGVGTMEKNNLLKIILNLGKSHPIILVEHDKDLSIKLTDFILVLENGFFIDAQYSTEF